ncbi:hypothetical protein [Nocardia otitidiscaviarum]|uniref:hypothetical protein n=1 Tax=Nocardia otitidiscaviarum TaxID=1823 RepID=UPI0011C05BC7|nr:hypothetical protein [Nocardia otitidiscaviarum]
MIAEVAAVLGGVGAGGIGTALVTGLLGRRKSRADAVAVLTQAAAQMVEPLSRQLAEVTAALEEHKRADRARQRQQRAAAARHVLWDNTVAEQLRALGAEVPAPPPLEVIS